MFEYTAAEEFAANLAPGRHVKTYEIPLRDFRPQTVSAIFVKGASPGPTFVAMAGEHGNELNGVAAVYEAASSVDFRELSGLLVAIPALNVANIAARNHCHLSERGKPYQRTDPFNTAFAWPGDPQGSPAGQICHYLTARVIPTPDVFVNLHGWTSLCVSAIDPLGTSRAIGELARSFGLLFTGEGHEAKRDGRLATLLASRGISSFAVELSGQWSLDRGVIELGRRGIINMLRHGNMLPGKVDLPPTQYIYGGAAKEFIVKSPSEGLFIPCVDQGKLVAKGEALGRIVNMETLESTPITAPVAGAVWCAARLGQAADTTLEGMHAYACRDEIISIVKEVRCVSRKQ